MFSRNCALPDTGPGVQSLIIYSQVLPGSFSCVIRDGLLLESQYNFSGAIAAFGPLMLCITMAFSTLSRRTAEIIYSDCDFLLSFTPKRSVNIKLSFRVPTGHKEGFNEEM